MAGILTPIPTSLYEALKEQRELLQEVCEALEAEEAAGVDASPDLKPYLERIRASLDATAAVE